MSVTTINGHVLLSELANWTNQPSFRRNWETTVAKGLVGVEKRRAMRQAPRTDLSWKVTASRARTYARLIHELQAGIQNVRVCAPWHGHSETLAAQASGSTLLLEVPHWPWAAGDRVLLHSGDRQSPTWEVAVVDSVDGAELTLTAGLGNTWPAGTQCWPLIYGRLVARGVQDGFLDAQQSEIRIKIEEEEAGSRAGVSTASTYLGRPVFPLSINWAAEVSRSWQFDFKAHDLGFGAGYLEKHQLHVVRGYRLPLQLRSHSEISTLDDFLADRLGPTLGWWLPGPEEPMEIVAGVSATQFDIVDQGLRDVWEDAPGSAYLWVTSGAASAGCKITGVADNGNGTERVTVTALPWTPTATATIQRLSFVRLADSGDSGEWLAEGWQSRSLTVVELPHEYAAAETGEQPVFLYRFWQETTPQKVWRFTSFATDVESDGDTFTAKAIDHGELSRGIGEDAETVKITGIWEAGNPFDFGYPLPSELPVEVEILETTFDDPDTTSVIFRGQIEAAPRRGRRVTATARAGRAIGRRRVPSAMIGPRCGYQLYDANTCGVDPTAFRFSGCTLDAVDGITIQISHPTAFDGLAAQWLTFGWITVGAGQTQERRGILQDTSVSSTVRELVLNFPLLANGAGAAVVAQPGCDGEWATCQDKFNNQNALLHPFVPDRNPTIDAFEIPQSQGGKKS